LTAPHILKEMIRNYTLSSALRERKRAGKLHAEANRFPTVLWSFLSGRRFCFLVNQAQQIFWGLTTPWAGEAQEGVWEGRGERPFPDGSAAGKCLDPGKAVV
jgi:hypothetical protein